MQYHLTGSAKKTLQLAEKAAKAGSQSALGTEHILLGLLQEGSGTAGRILQEAGVRADKLRELMDKLVNAETGTAQTAGRLEMTPRASFVMDNAAEEAASFHQEKIGTDHILLAMIRETDCVATRLLYTMGVNLQKVYLEVLQAMGMDAASAREELQSLRSSASENVSATPTLERYSRDLTRMAAAGRLDPVVGREQEISRIIQILSRRTKNNPCLVGEPGVGKTAIVEGLAQRIVEGTVPEAIMGRRVLVLDMSGMVAGSKYRGEFEERIKKVIQEVMSHPGILLFIDELLQHL